MSFKLTLLRSKGQCGRHHCSVIIRHRVGAHAPPDDRLRRMIQYAETAMDELDRLRLLDARRSLSSGSPKARPGGGHDSFRDAST
jgi:hypothetical protein